MLFYIKERTKEELNIEKALKIYDENLHKTANKKFSANIMKDRDTTFPEKKYATEEYQALSLLSNVLHAIAAYRPDVGYVTGMNFLTASLLNHADGHIAFWIIVQLLDNYGLNEIYEVGRPGITRHSYIIELLLSGINEKFKSGSASEAIRMLCTEWAYSLFTIAIPFEISAFFIDILPIF